MIALIQQNLYEKAKICQICKEKFEDKHAKDKKYRKVTDHCHYRSEYKGAADSTSNLNFSLPNEITIVFQNVHNYDYHFFIKELAEKFEGQITCLRENIKKYKTFSIPLEKEVATIDKNEKEITKNISYRLQLINRAQFMASSGSNLVNNLAGKVHEI